MASSIDWADGLDPEIDYTPTQLNDDLVLASRHGNKEWAEDLLQQGAKVDYWCHPRRSQPSFEETVYQSSAIAAACQEGHLDLVLLLYKHSKRKEYIKDYWPILMETLKHRWHLRGMPVVNNDGELVYVCIDHFTYHIFFMISPPILKYLIQAGADINVKCPTGQTPLMMAAGCLRNKLVLDFLLSAKADLDLVDSEEFTALTHAVKFRNTEAVKRLLDEGADTNTSIKDYPYNNVCFPLIFSISQGNMEYVNLLMNYKIEPTDVSQFLLYKMGILDFNDLAIFSKMASPLHIALYCSEPDLARLFIQRHFITRIDVTELAQDQALRERLESATGSRSPDVLEIFRSIESNPWSLFKLTFLTISEIIGFSRDREEKLQTLGLPQPIVRKLLFLPH